MLAQQLRALGDAAAERRSLLARFVLLVELLAGLLAWAFALGLGGAWSRAHSLRTTQLIHSCRGPLLQLRPWPQPGERVPLPHRAQHVTTARAAHRRSPGRREAGRSQGTDAEWHRAPLVLGEPKSRSTAARLALDAPEALLGFGEAGGGPPQALCITLRCRSWEPSAPARGYRHRQRFGHALARESQGDPPKPRGSNHYE